MTLDRAHEFQQMCLTARTSHLIKP